MNEDRSLADRLLEIIAVLLLGVTTLGTAWCGYQATQWSGTQSEHNRIEAEHRLEANRQFGRAVHQLRHHRRHQYAQAVQSGDTTLAEFCRQTLARPALLPVLDDWVGKSAPGRHPPH